MYPPDIDVWVAGHGTRTKLCPSELEARVKSPPKPGQRPDVGQVNVGTEFPVAASIHVPSGSLTKLRPSELEARVKSPPKPGQRPDVGQVNVGTGSPVFASIQQSGPYVVTVWASADRWKMPTATNVSTATAYPMTRETKIPGTDTPNVTDNPKVLN
jgi:hypothetical protein